MPAMSGKPSIGRPRNPGTDAERAESRRAKVRINVQAFRRRQRERRFAAATQDNRNSDQGPLSPPKYYWSDSASSLASSPSPSWQEHESDYADPDSWIWQLSRDLGSEPAYQDAFLAALQHQCIHFNQIQDRIVYEPCKRFGICCSTWIHAGSLEIGTPGLQIMNDAVLASALTVIGRSRGDIDMTMRGAFIQSRAFRGLRITLQRLAAEEENVSCPVLAMQALTCAISELLTSHDWDNFASHLMGVGALVEHGGPERLRSREARDHFYGYRSLQAAFSFMHGHAQFLADPEWITPSWQHEVEMSRHPLHTMLDVAFKVVPEMTRHRSRQIWRLAESKECLQRLRIIASQLDDWERKVRSGQGGSLYSRKDAVWTGLYDYAFDFASLSVAIAYAMYTGVRIKLACLIRQVMLELVAQDPGASVDPKEAMWEGLGWARQALQSLEYFHTGRPKACGKIVTLFPLEASWSFISDVHTEGGIDTIDERQWCLATAHRLSSKDFGVFRWR